MQDLTIVVTGSVAAVKTALLAKALERRNFNLSFVITPSARPFLENTGKYRASDAALAAIDAKTLSPEKIKKGAVLIAPATAEIIKQLATNEKLGRIVNRRARPLLIAPAMNFMMWQHPAVQDNIKKLKKSGAIIIGPVQGEMACGDYGHGRMVEPDKIAKTVVALLNKNKARMAQTPQPKETRWPPFSMAKRILFFADDPVIAKPLARRLKKQGYKLETITRKFFHYQADPQGMEHIRLPEANDLVIFAGLKKDLAHEMAQGGASSFAACLYLASKRPVAIVPSKISPPAKSALEKLRARGAHIPALGKKMLILNGDVREKVDSFRFYTNRSIAVFSGKIPASATLIKAQGSTPDLLAAVAKHPDADIVLQFANIPQIICPFPADHKISKTGSQRKNLFRVKGNVEIRSTLEKIFPLSRIAGFDTRQKWFGAAEFKKFVPFTPAAKKIRTRRVKNGIKGKIVVTTGRTEERLAKSGLIITNPFTGRQGQEIAKAFARRNYSVTLISGPTSLPDIGDPRVKTVHVTTMREMERAALKSLADAPLAFVSAAAIADFSIKKPLALALAPGANFTLPLTENPSIVGSVGAHKKRPPVVVSFAAQSPDEILRYATRKFKKLAVDMTVANPIGEKRSILHNKIHLITKKGIKSFPEMTKTATAEIIVKEIVKMLDKNFNPTAGANSLSAFRPAAHFAPKSKA